MISRRGEVIAIVRLKTAPRISAKKMQSNELYRTSLILLATVFGSTGCDSNGNATFLKPAVPVVVTYRDSVLGEGKVAVISNQTANRLTISVKLDNIPEHQTKTVGVDLEPNGKAEIGWLEGWRFLTGETITISHPEYSSIKKTIP